MGFVLYISLFLRVLGWWVRVHVHTQTTLVLDVSPGVGRTPGELEETRSTREIMLFNGKPMGSTKA